MSILAHLKQMEESCIFKLEFDNRIVGLRVKWYSLNEFKFKYYDFETSYVKRQDLKDYLITNSKLFKTLNLIEYNGVVCTQDEINGTIQVEEFKDEMSAEHILDLVIKVLQDRGE